MSTITTTTTDTPTPATEDDSWAMALDVWNTVERHGYPRASDRDAAHSSVFLQAALKTHLGHQDGVEIDAGDEARAMTADVCAVLDRYGWRRRSDRAADRCVVWVLALAETYAGRAKSGRL
ncbi:hypothetical protein [Actinomadura litoris]|uniref:hypothetical protein n=1 Tax=Actinomadura litoris TaxID=2678616 RepID=UPI001FA6AB73|nr:hypothetical protein [Actinomadura litoris]